MLIIVFLSDHSVMITKDHCSKGEDQNIDGDRSHSDYVVSEIMLKGY